MNILFLQKPFFMEPLGVMYLSSSLKQGGHKVDIITTDEDVSQKIKEYKPQIIASSVMTGDHQMYSETIKKIKTEFPEVTFVAGGPHPTFFPAYLKESSFDAIGRGECESAFNEFCTTLEKGDDISQVKNFWIKNKGGEIIKNNVRPLENDLDSLPFPDRDLARKYAIISQTPILHFLSSRGCPFDCSYCFNHSFSKLYRDESGSAKQVRFRGVENLVREIEEAISDFPTSFVYFQDDTFILNQKKVNQFADKYPSKVGLPFHVHVRANLINPSLVSTLRDAGCYSVHMAAETANDEIRNKLLRRNMTKDQIISASHEIKKSGIKLMLQNMIGLPDSTLDDDLETVRLNQQCKPDCSWVSIFQPYPGTWLGDYCKNKGLYDGNFSDLDSGFFDKSVLNFPDERKKQLANLQKLFGLMVENPWLLDPEIYGGILSAEHDQVGQFLQDVFRGYRKKTDIDLYGFELPTSSHMKVKSLDGK